MSWLPGWENIASVSFFFRVFQWIVVVAGALAFVYGERRQELSDLETKDKIYDVEQKYAPRRLTSEQKIALIEGLKKIGQSRTVILVRLMDREGAALGEDFSDVFTQAGWPNETLKTALSNDPGIRLVLEDDQYSSLAVEIENLLSSAGLFTSPSLAPKETGAAVKPFRDVGIAVGLYIGPKM